jgi:DNA-binding response OmpR family regulator
MIHAMPDAEPQIDVNEQPRTILIVDDDEDQAFCLATRLESQGFEAVVTHTGQHALVSAQIEPPDLVLLDLLLPDLNGLDVCAELADDPKTSDTPVIILSGMDRSDIVRSSRAAGCRFFVHKPYDPNALLALIEAALDGDEF